MSSGIARNWGTTSEERALAFPGDLDVDGAWRALFRGVSIAAPAAIGRGERLFGSLRCTYCVRPETPDRVRLLVKLRVAPPRGLTSRLGVAALAWGDLVMMRRQLLNLKALAETQSCSAAPDRAGN